MMLLAKEQFTDFIKTNGLFSSDETILLAISGGKDSVLMAHLFAECGFRFAIAHCNFNLRGEESLSDQKFVEALAKQFNVPLHTIQFDTLAYATAKKISIQMAARDLRYAFFEETRVKHNYSKIAVAQHQSDATETVLINLIRGTGIKGLHGIKVERDLIIRPMLCFNAIDIQNIVAQHQIEYVEDSSNASNKYMRNKLRLDIIPQMKTLNPSLDQTFQQNLSYFNELEVLLNERVKKLAEEIIFKNDEQLSISFKEIYKLNPQHLLLYELLKPFGFNSSQVKNIINGLEGLSGKQFYSNTHILTVDRNNVIITANKDKFIKTAVNIFYDNEEAIFANKKITIKASQQLPASFKGKNNICYVNVELLIYPLILRYWKKGDIFKPIGMQGFKKLSDYFIQQKIPQEQKKNIPILVNGNNEIIWICGYRSDDRYKVDLNTKKIIIFELHN